MYGVVPGLPSPEKAWLRERSTAGEVSLIRALTMLRIHDL